MVALAEDLLVGRGPGGGVIRGTCLLRFLLNMLFCTAVFTRHVVHVQMCLADSGAPAATNTHIHTHIHIKTSQHKDVSESRIHMKGILTNHHCVIFWLINSGKTHGSQMAEFFHLCRNRPCFLSDYYPSLERTVIVMQSFRCLLNTAVRY